MAKKMNMQGRFISLVVAFSSLTGIVFGQQTIEQEFEFDADLSVPFVDLTVQPFDSENGTRQLIGLSLVLEARIDMEVEVSNFTTLDLETGEWFYDAGANMILAFDEKTGYENGGPFYGLGGVFQSGITGELSAGSGGPPPPFGNPTPGDVTVTADLNNDFESTIVSDVSLSYFVGDEPLKAKLAPFQDFIVSPPEGNPDGFIEGKATLLEYSGFLTVTYNWVEGLGRPEDCNGDGNVDAEDLNCICDSNVSVEALLVELNLLKGDLDQDGDVAFPDFLILSEGFGAEGNYLEGDLDCDGEVGFGDFLLLADSFGQTTNEELAVVPEPDLVTIFLPAFLAIVINRRRQNSPRR